MAETYTVALFQGATYNKGLIYKDSTGTVIDITGYSARMPFRYKSKTGVCALNLLEGSGLTITPLSGRVDIEITSAQTALLTRDMFYTLELFTPNDDNVIRLLAGPATLDLEVKDCV